MSALISHQQLVKAKRILYMTHLAIGDFVYQGIWLKGLKAKYPHLTIDIWFDDCRRKPHSWAAGRNSILTEWIKKEGDCDIVYPIVGSLKEREQQIGIAKKRDYDLILFIGKNRSEQYAKIARKISSSAFVVAAKSKPLNNPIAKWWYFNNVDGQFSYDEFAIKNKHITGLYEDSFARSLGLTLVDLEGKKQITISSEEQHEKQAQAYIQELTQKLPDKKVVFVNHLSTSTIKDYPWIQLKSLLLMLNSRYDNLAFVINTPPDKINQVTDLVNSDVELSKLLINTFTAKQSFFQLPALMAECDIVIGVDTATAHLAVCVDKPQVAIMASDFKLWQPLGDSIILEGSGKASSITPEQVADAFTQQMNKF